MHRFLISTQFISGRLLGSRSSLVMASLMVVGLCLILACGAPLAVAQTGEDPTPLPAQFDANRIYVTPVSATGDSLRLFTDTGGGKYPILTKPAVERLSLSVTDTLTRGRRSIPMVLFPDVPGIPAPNHDRALVMPKSRHAQLLDLGDGTLGQGWFAGAVWTFDYGAERLLHHSSREGISFDPTHTVEFGFQTDSTGKRISNHPRIEARIAGKTYSFLFDTGATSVIADSTQKALDWPKRIGSSFVIDSVFTQWQRKHPDWKVVERASVFRGGTPMIRVPEVTVAGHTVGPVWFERRPDRAFKKGMAQSMDEPVEGALGGSFLQYFRVSVDYPKARAYFTRVE